MADPIMKNVKAEQSILKKMIHEWQKCFDRHNAGSKVDDKMYRKAHEYLNELQTAIHENGYRTYEGEFKMLYMSILLDVDKLVFMSEFVIAWNRQARFKKVMGEMVNDYLDVVTMLK